MQKYVPILIISAATMIFTGNTGFSQDAPISSAVMTQTVTGQVKPDKQKECAKKAAEDCEYLGRGTPGYNNCVAVEIAICMGN